MASDKNQELQKIAYEINYYRTQAQEVQKQLVTLQAMLEEHSQTISALNSLDAMNTETLFPLGSGAFTKAKVTDVKRVLIEVGARAIVEKPVNDAVKILEDKKTNLEKALKETQAAFAQVLARIEELNQTGQALSQAR